MAARASRMGGSGPGNTVVKAGACLGGGPVAAGDAGAGRADDAVRLRLAQGSFPVAEYAKNRPTGGLPVGRPELCQLISVFPEPSWQYPAEADTLHCWTGVRVAG